MDLSSFVTLPEAVDRAENLTRLFFFKSLEKGGTRAEVIGEFYSQLEQNHVFSATYGRDAQTWNEYWDQQLQKGYVGRDENHFRLTAQGGRWLRVLEADNGQHG